MSNEGDLKKYDILVVDDEPDITNLFFSYLNELGYNITVSNSSEGAKKVFREKKYDIVLLDINMPVMSGLQLLQIFKKQNPDIVVIMISAVREIDIVVKSIQMGAYDYLSKPIVDMNQVKIRIDRAISDIQIRQENISLRKELAQKEGIPEIKSDSVAMKKVIDMIHTVAEYDTTVFITGESGTGKEVAARTIHNLSNRTGRPFILVNCGGIPQTLLESNLFGYEKGAFTGAAKQTIGLFEESNKGTILLDEITETTIEFQTQLLHVIESNKIRRVGGTREVELDLRIIAATNQNIEQMVENGEFREDLYYRLNVFRIDLPPLKKRKEDIPAIAKLYLDKFTRKINKNNLSLSPDVLKLLMLHEWKGNIRELINVIENAVIMCNSNEISVNDLPPSLLSGQDIYPQIDLKLEGYQSAKELFEYQYFANLVETADGNITQASKMAGISRQHFHLKLKNLGITDSKHPK